jgi:predicted GNAT family N-acyltransferase
MFARPIAGESELQTCLQIRREVFIEEQGVAKSLELDGLEEQCEHFIAFLHTEGDAAQPAVGTARLLIDVDGVAKAQRVAVLAHVRGHGVGRIIMQAVEEAVGAHGLERLVLGAQMSAVPFYEELGYTCYGDVFDDAGIPHLMMAKVLG